MAMDTGYRSQQSPQSSTSNAGANQDYRAPSKSGDYGSWAQHDVSAQSDTQPLASGSSVINVGPAERVASLLGGVALMTYGFKRSGLTRALLAVAGGALVSRGASGYCSVNAATGRNTASSEQQTVPVEISSAAIVAKPRQEVYAFWRNLENLPKFMDHLQEVRQIDRQRSHWIAKAPKNLGRLSWDAVIVDEQENERLAWQSLPHALVDNAGEVIFRDAPGGQGTEVQVRIHYRPPAGAAGAVIARVLNPMFSRMVKDDVRRFKYFIESGAQERGATASGASPSAGAETVAGRSLV